VNSNRANAPVCLILALFGRASRANQCPVSGVKQPCPRNLETADFDPQETLAESKSRNAAISRDAEVWYAFGWKRGRHWQ
jgi:hypothetical protein